MHDVLQKREKISKRSFTHVYLKFKLNFLKNSNASKGKMIIFSNLEFHELVDSLKKNFREYV